MGKYAVNYKTDYHIHSSRAKIDVTYSSIHIHKVLSKNLNFIEKLSGDIPAYIIKVTGLQEGQKVSYRNINDAIRFEISSDGEYQLPASGDNYTGFQCNFSGVCNIVIEQIPDYQGALVSDGVDDYGWCGNFPILTKEKGYTVVAIRKWINDTQPRCLLSTHDGASYGAFQMEKYNDIGFFCFNFGASTGMQSFSPNDIVYQTSLTYNGNIELAKGNSDGTSVLNLFRYMANQEYGSAALYALEIYDRVLTDGEIAKVKERMITEYEEKTGNTYEEETI